MSNTQLLSFRIPIDVLTKIDAEARRDGRSRSAVLTRILQHTTFSDAGLIFTGMVDSGGRSSAVEHSPGTHRNKAGETLHVAGSNPAPSNNSHIECDSAGTTKCTQAGHSGFQRADGYWCSTCRRMYP